MPHTRDGTRLLVACTIIDFHFMLTSELDYNLPPDLIAQTPVEPRDASRLMVIDRATGSIAHHHFYELDKLLHEHDLLVANDSRVIPARLYGTKPSGGKVELLLLRKLDALTWRGLVGGRNVSTVELVVHTGRSIQVDVEMSQDDGDWLLRFSEPIDPYLESLGAMPLPPYIHTRLDDPTRYQTVYARISGSAAAPTAGLHFTPGLIGKLAQSNVDLAFVTLHVGLDTFKPISEDVVEEHKIHGEWCGLPDETANAIRTTRLRGRRVVAVGTTSARVLETAGVYSNSHTPAAFSGFTRLYITPCYSFKVVDAMITNFHLPKSTLLAMIGAFMGLDLLRLAYQEAMQLRYRFYSFGDAMLIL